MPASTQPAPRILDEPEAPAPPVPVADVIDRAYAAAAAAGGTLSQQTAPQFFGLVIEMGDVDELDCPADLWRWLAWMAGAGGGAIIYTDPAGRRLRFRLDGAGGGNGGYWYASHYDRASGRTLNVYVGTHRSGAIEGPGLEKGAERIASKCRLAAPSVPMG